MATQTELNLGLIFRIPSASRLKGKRLYINHNKGKQP